MSQKIAMKWLGIVTVVIALCGGTALAQQIQISTAQLEEMFDNIRAKTTWDINGPMLWGYFFTSSSKGELEEIGEALVRQGYHLVDTREREPDSAEEAPEWQLHVERVEPHTVATLNNRNVQLEGIAMQHRNVIYDGMDVGPAK